MVSVANCKIYYGLLEFIQAYSGLSPKDTCIGYLKQKMLEKPIKLGLNTKNPRKTGGLMMVGNRRLELRTSCMSSRRSSQLS